MELTTEQKNKILAATEIVENGDVAVLLRLMALQSLMDNWQSLLDKLQEDIESKTSSLSVEVQSESLSRAGDVNSIKEEISSLKAELQQLAEDAKSSIEDLQTILSADKEIDSAKVNIPPEIDLQPILEQIEALKNGLPSTFDEIEKKLEQNLPKLGTSIRDGLELLQGDERLDISAIRGIEKSNTNLSDAIIERAIGIVDQRTSFLIQKVSNLQNQVNNFTSTSSGAAFAVLTATGALGQNSFTFTTAPSVIVVDGIPKQKVQTDSTVNWTGTTSVVLTVAPNFDIFGY